MTRSSARISHWTALRASRCPEVRASLVAYLNDGAPFDVATTGDAKVRGLVHLIMSTPVYQSA